MNKLEGSCMCGAVQYRVVGDCRDIVACHCTQCRKASGHFAAATATRPENLELIRDDTLKWYRSSSAAQRGFCVECGCTLFWKPDSGDRVSIYVGTIHGPTGLPLSSHIYAQEKGDYYEINDDVPTFATSGAKLSVS